MAKNKKRANEGDGASSSSSPPLKRQKIGAASSSTDVSIDEMAARNLLLEQRLQVNFLGMKMKPGDEVARLHVVEESLQLQKEDRTTIKDCNLPQFK